ncbi:MULTISPECIES: YraN family protein [unclassified Treponema]|uniref:YraN family protein n=1 Tax=unclassified Treponema TaxID=2638727 RepID=UPI0020A409C8|nr:MULTISPECIES: YraN family protein [unclassified Treponema]UTC66080.1 YraN family protein [Treponema sp. OMZ 789]UTC68810.1 YraN family protein [Treponema sp. OMZ 790]UTC71538.1 YraN family protein [Treponema sp. OMZ 791]
MDSLGSKGENRISEWLTDKGYLILEQNWRTRTGEIDIIALDKTDQNRPCGVLVFIEVKTLLKTELSDLDLIINKKKQERIIKTAKCFLANHRKYNKMYIRFDVVVLQSNPFLEQPLKVLHLEDAFGDCYD